MGYADVAVQTRAVQRHLRGRYVARPVDKVLDTRRQLTPLPHLELHYSDQQTTRAHTHLLRCAMSIVGISPSDIAAGIKVGHKAVKAVGEGENGSRARYQHSKRAIAHRVRAVQDCFDAIASSSSSLSSTSPSSSSPSHRDDLHRLLSDADQTFLAAQCSYQESLGHGSPKGTAHGVIRKLKYAFDGDAKVTQHLEDSRPFIDAALFRVLQAHHESTQQSYTHLAENLLVLSQDMRAKLDQCSTARDSQALQDRLDEKCNDLTRQLAAAMDLRLPYNPQQPINVGNRNSTTNSSQPWPARHPSETRQTKTRSAARKRNGARARKVDKRIKYCETPFQGTSNVSAYSWPPMDSSPDNTRTSDGHNELTPSRQHPADGGALIGAYAITALILGLASRDPNIQKLGLALWKHSRNDPLLATLVACVFTSIIRYLLPRQISLESDDSVMLETALGEQLKVASCYWRATPLLHGFLEHHFRDRPGSQLVRGRRYRILVGGLGGIVVEESKWQVVTKHMKLTMAMVLETENVCPRCDSELAERTSTALHCEHCNYEYSTVAESHDNKAPQYTNHSLSSSCQVDASILHPQQAMMQYAVTSQDLLAFANILLTKLHSSAKSDSVTEEPDAAIAASELDTEPELSAGLSSPSPSLGPPSVTANVLEPSEVAPPSSRSDGDVSDPKAMSGALPAFGSFTEVGLSGLSDDEFTTSTEAEPTKSTEFVFSKNSSGRNAIQLDDRSGNVPIRRVLTPKSPRLRVAVEPTWKYDVDRVGHRPVLSEGYDSSTSSAASLNSSNARAFSQMLDQYNELQQQTMLENMEMQKAQAFWNPLESMSRRDATS